MKTDLFQDQEALSALCRSYGIRRLSLFGSRLTGTHLPESDVDLLIEFAPEVRPNLFDMVAIEDTLSNMLGGLRVDLRTPKDLSRFFREDILKQAEVQYESS